MLLSIGFRTRFMYFIDLFSDFAKYWCLMITVAVFLLSIFFSQFCSSDFDWNRWDSGPFNLLIVSWLSTLNLWAGFKEACMAHLWLNDGSTMAHLWLNYGSIMAQLWLRVWLIYGSFMAHLWLNYGSFMAQLWLNYGSFMAQIIKCCWYTPIVIAKIYSGVWGRF